MKKLFLVLAFAIANNCLAQNTNDGGYKLYITQIATAEAFLQLNKISTATAYLNVTEEQYRDIEWKFLNSFLNQNKKSVTKQRVSSFTDIKISHDGKILAVAASDSLVTLYSYPSLMQLKELKGHNGSVSTLAFSNDGKLLVSGGRDHKVVLWDVSTGKSLWENESSFTQGIYQVRFTLDNSQIGVVSWEYPKGAVEGFAKLLDMKTGIELNKIITEPHPAAGVIFTNDGKNMIVSSWGEIVFSYDLSTNQEIWRYDLSDKEEYNAFHSIDLSPKGKQLLLGSADHRVHILNSTTGELLHRIEPWEGHTKTVKVVKYSNDGKWFATAGEDQTIYIWDAENYTKKHSLIGHTKTVTGLAWSNDGRVLISTSIDGTIRSWNIQNLFEQRYEVCDFGPWQNPITSDGRYFVAACSDKSLAVYETNTGKQKIELGEQSALCADISRDDKYAVTASFDGVVRLWNLVNGKEVLALEGHTSRVDGIAYWNASQQILSVGDTTLRIWDIKNGKQAREISLSKNPFRLVLSPDEKTAFIGFHDGTILSYDTDSWQQKSIYIGQKDLNEITVSPNGKSLAVFTGKDIEVWNTDSGTLEYKLTGHEQTGYAIGFSPDSRYLISGSYDQTFKLWNLERKGICTLTFHGYEETVYTSKFINNSRIFIGSSQGIMYFYDFE
jgi:WD40 repeat protein